jgi:hypothetical protein
MDNIFAVIQCGIDDILVSAHETREDAERALTSLKEEITPKLATWGCTAQEDVDEYFVHLFDIQEFQPIKIIQNGNDLSDL